MAYISRSARSTTNNLNSREGAWWAGLTQVDSSILSSAFYITTSWAENLCFSTPWTSMFVITRYVILRASRAVIIDRTINFLETSLFITVVTTSASLLHHSFRGAEVTRRTFYRPFRTKRTVITINTRYTILLF